MRTVPDVAHRVQPIRLQQPVVLPLAKHGAQHREVALGKSISHHAFEA
jgi:hypothetical protein